MTGETCAKCGKEPRAGKSRYGRACLSAAKRRQRETSGETSRETSARETARETADGMTSPAAAPRGRSSPTRPGLHAECLRRIEELVEEVERLKRELAQAGQRAAPMPRRVEAAAKPDPRRVQFGRPKVSKEGEVFSGPPAHGAHCSCVYCRASRVGA